MNLFQANPTLIQHFKLCCLVDGLIKILNLTPGFAIMPLPDNRVVFNVSENFDVAEEEPRSKFPKVIILLTLLGLILLVICLIVICWL